MRFEGSGKGKKKHDTRYPSVSHLLFYLHNMSSLEHIPEFRFLCHQKKLLAYSNLRDVLPTQRFPNPSRFTGRETTKTIVACTPRSVKETEYTDQLLTLPGSCLGHCGWWIGQLVRDGGADQRHHEVFALGQLF
ncbi:hypothetical protein ACN38_g5995 [Penicillium nordicum]|uniref:Uncharacterized protein n=1 Tax=Penicillium nordicum TaxID=229535 RepID=A0A0M8P8U2_9EURO|nr:hypothetical protein ACN38_g5995 [Penicillium nordicum]